MQDRTHFILAGFVKADRLKLRNQLRRRSILSTNQDGSKTLIVLRPGAMTEMQVVQLVAKLSGERFDVVHERGLWVGRQEASNAQA